MRGLVEETGAHPCLVAPVGLARAARKARTRGRSFLGRTRHSARSRDPYDPASFARNDRRPANWHLHPARLRHLRLTILRESTDSLHLTAHQLAVAASTHRQLR